jgi:glycosyltransferase involved in cell wall biosynthesis
MMNQQNISVLFLTKYAYNGPSSRYRSFQYLPYLDQHPVHYQVSPLFNEDYLTHYYQSGRAFLSDVVRAFFTRLAVLTTVKKYSLVVIEYELLPYFPAFLERYLTLLKIPYVVDYDDALFHQYDQHSKAWIRKLLGGKIAKVMKHSSLVVAGNDYLAHYARQAGSPKVQIIPTVIDLVRYPIKPPSPDINKTFTIGWIGSPSTSVYLKAIAPALAKLCENSGVSIRLIGAANLELPHVKIENLAWDEETEVALLQQVDVGIMPLPDEPWARGKCGFKLIQYMACGLPVVASPVGVNSQIVEQGVNGFLAETPEQWAQALQTLWADSGLRHQMGAAGRQKVEQQYCIQKTGPKWAELLIAAARSLKTRASKTNG